MCMSPLTKARRGSLPRRWKRHVGAVRSLEGGAPKETKLAPVHNFLAATSKTAGKVRMLVSLAAARSPMPVPSAAWRQLTSGWRSKSKSGDTGVRKINRQQSKKAGKRKDHMPPDGVRAPTEQGSSAPNSRSLVWQPLDQAPVGEPVLLLVQGRDDPVVAVQDDDGDWQVTWTGDLIIDPIRWAPMPPGFDAPA